MPTKRHRHTRAYAPQSITPAELAWLSGEPQAGANPWWIHIRGREKYERCRALLMTFAHLIPPGRMPQLLEDLEHWAPRRP